MGEELCEMLVLAAAAVARRFLNVFDDLMRRVERRRLTLDGCDDRRHDRVQRERPEAEREFTNPTSGQKNNPTFGRKKKI